MEKNKMKMASWNLRNLSKKRNDITEIVKIFKEFDLIAVQEVRDEIIIKRICEQSGHQYIISEPVGTPRHKEYYVFAYRAGEVKSFATLWDNAFVRPPFAGFFKFGEFDFILATIHVVWGKKCERVAEASHLHAVLEKVLQFSSSSSSSSKPCFEEGKPCFEEGKPCFEEGKQGFEEGGEKDIILCGDFNTTPAKFPNMGDWKCVIKSGGSTMNNKGITTGNLYDNIWCNSFTGELIGGGIYPMNDIKISDHHPVWAEFKTDHDDDEGDVDLSKN